MQILVTGVPRSGGSLFLSLLDGHSELLAYPFKARFARGFDYPINPAKQTTTLRSHLEAEQRWDLFVRVFAGDKISVLQQPDLAGFCNDMEAPAPHSGFEIVNAISRSFFWRATNRSQTTEHFCWHSTNMHYGNLIDCVNKFKDIKIISVIRHPLDSYISHSRYKTSWKFDLNNEILTSIYCGLFFYYISSRLPNQIQVIRYESLLNDPERTIKEVCNWLSIDFENILLEPTVLNQPWAANTSFEDRKNLTRISSLDFRFLNFPDLISRVREKRLHNIMKQIGYGIDAPYYQDSEIYVSAEQLIQLNSDWAQNYVISLRNSNQTNIGKKTLGYLERHFSLQKMRNLPKNDLHQMAPL